MREVNDWVRRAAGSRATDLLTSETGTGKEVVARSIHQRGADADQPFLAVNLAALPESMVESELFGDEGRVHRCGPSPRGPAAGRGCRDRVPR